MTIYRATVLDTPDSPFTGGRCGRRGCRNPGAGRGDPGPRHRSPTSRGTTPARRSSTCAAGAAARVRRHPRPLPAAARHRRDRHAAAGLARPVRPPRGGAARRPALRPYGGRRVRPAGSSRAGHHQRARLRVALRQRRGLLVRRGRPGWACASPRASSSATGCYDRRPAVDAHPGAPTRRARPSPSAGTGQGRLRYAVTPRFSLFGQSGAMLESCAALAKDVDGAWFTSHVNENRRRDRRRSRGQHRLAIGLPRHLRPVRAGRTVRASSPTTCTPRAGARPCSAPRRRRWRTARRATRPWQWPLPAAAARRVRHPGGARLGRRGRHRPVAAQGGAAGLLHPAAAAGVGLALTAAHLLHLATRAGADALGLARRGRPVGGAPVRRGLGPAARGQHAGDGAGCTPRTGRRAGQGLRARRRRRHRRRLGGRAPACWAEPDPGAPGHR